MVPNKRQNLHKTGVKNKLKPKNMEEKEDAIEFHLCNKDIWKEFIDEPKQNKSSCMLIEIQIKVFEVLAKTYYYTAEIKYEIFELTKSVKKVGKAVVLNQNKIRSASLAHLITA